MTMGAMKYETVAPNIGFVSVKVPASAAAASPGPRGKRVLHDEVSCHYYGQLALGWEQELRAAYGGERAQDNEHQARRPGIEIERLRPRLVAIEGVCDDVGPVVGRLAITPIPPLFHDFDRPVAWSRAVADGEPLEVIEYCTQFLQYRKAA